MDFEQAVKSIITQQELIIGPVAIEEATKVPGLAVTKLGKELKVTITGEGKPILEKLVSQYAALFGRVSVEVCRDAVMSSVGYQKELLPDILK